MLLKGFYEILRPLSPHTRLAKDRRTGREVAVREIALCGLKDWKVLERLEAEARILARVRHPSVPAFIDSFSLDEETPDPRFFLVRAFVPGTPLSSYRSARPSLEEILSLGDRLLSALGELHSLSPPLFHGALTPERILEVPGAGSSPIPSARGAPSEALIKTLVFLGFGTSSLAGDLDASDYSAPERAGGPATAASDLYSVGAILYHLASGDDPGALARRDGYPQLPSTIAPRLRGALSLLLATDPDARPASAAHARKAWREGVETALALPPETALASRRRQAKRTGSAAALIALLGSALALSSPSVALLLLPAMIVALYLTLRPGETDKERGVRKGEE